MTERVTVGNLRVAPVLYDFINGEALPGTDLDPDTFWSGVDKVVADLTPKNQDLLAQMSQIGQLQSATTLQRKLTTTQIRPRVVTRNGEEVECSWVPGSC